MVSKVIKTLMIVFNMLFLVAGLALFGGGIWVVVDASAIRDTLSNNFGVSGNISDYFAGVMIAMGGVVVIVAFLGCCGAMKESSCMLTCFNVFLVIFILIEVGIAVSVWVLAPSLKTYLEEPARTVIQNTYGIPGQESVTQLYDQIQQDHSCCGFNNGDDFKGAAYLSIPLTTTYTNPWPQSCCEPGATAIECRDTNPPVKSYNEKGCFGFVEALLQRYSNLVGGVMSGLAGFQFVALIFSYCITCSSGKNTVGPY